MNYSGYVYCNRNICPTEGTPRGSHLNLTWCLGAKRQSCYFYVVFQFKVHQITGGMCP